MYHFQVQEMTCMQLGIISPIDHMKIVDRPPDVSASPSSKAN